MVEIELNNFLIQEIVDGKKKTIRLNNLNDCIGKLNKGDVIKAYEKWRTSSWVGIELGDITKSEEPFGEEGWLDIQIAQVVAYTINLK